LIIQERSRKDLVVGVPHYAPGGVKNLPCEDHPDSDENAGYLGDYIADQLDCCSVVAANYATDPNKSPDSDYARQIAEWAPQLLLEIHGHGGAKAAPNMIEVSCGSLERNARSMKFAEGLRESAKRIGFEVSGDFRSIYFKASKTATIVDSRWLAFHIELPPALRVDDNNPEGKPPSVGFTFCDAIASVLLEAQQGR
jgi:hypothetical protein